MAESRLILSSLLGSLPQFVTGNAWWGVNITGTWVGTISFFAATDGLNFVPLDAIPWPPVTSPPTVQTTTVNGSWYVPVLNYQTIAVTMTAYTSGSAIVQMASSIDTSFQSVFLASSLKWRNSQAYEATNTLTLAALPNGAWRLKTLVISADATPTWASSPALQIKDGSTLLWGMDPPLVAGSYNVPLPPDLGGAGVSGGGIVGTAGNAMTISLASSAGSSSSSASAAGGRTNINVLAGAA